MKSVNKKIGLNLLIAGILGIMLVSLVSAIGISCLYSKNIPLKMYPGEQIIIALKLGNSDIEGKVSLEGSLISGSEIASLDRESYVVSYEEPVNAKMTITIPETVSVGDTYEIIYKFRQVDVGSGEGGVSVGQAVQSGFDVIVIEKPAEPEVEQPAEEGMGFGWVILIIIIILVIIIVLYSLIRKKK